MEHRDFEVRSVNTEQRIVEGVAIPYRGIANVGTYKERIERGAVDTSTRPKFYWNHSDVIGIVDELRDEEDGLIMRAKISKTRRGDETLELINDGAVQGLSIGFRPVESRNDGEVVVRTKIEVREVSAVPFPAYQEAVITEVREEQNLQEETNMEEINELRSNIEEIERSVALLQVKERPAKPAFHSVGHWLKRGVEGDENFTRALDTSVVADDPTAGDSKWADYFYNLVDLGRPLTSAFGVSPLPDSGNTVSYLQVSQVASVGNQATEGTELASQGIAFTEATASVKTYGGANRLSRQVIDRSDVNYLEATMRSLGVQYGKAIEGATKTAVEAATWTTGEAITAGSAASYLNAVADAAADIYLDTGYQAEFVAVAKAQFIDIVKQVDSAGRPIFAMNNDGQNTLGSVNVARVNAQIAGLPVILVPQLTAGSLFVFSSNAFDIWENSGAPLQLVQEQISTLQRDVAVYGYAAFGQRDGAAGSKSAVA